MYYKSSTLQRPFSSNSNFQTEILPYLNTLDKCTQILRDDRLWIRNQLKAGNQELLQLFKKPRKSQNLQNFQIKLRKYIAGLKAKTKMENLLKFKENVRTGRKRSSFTYEKLNYIKQKQRYSSPKIGNCNFGQQKHYSSQISHPGQKRQTTSMEKMKEEPVASTKLTSENIKKVLESSFNQVNKLVSKNTRQFQQQKIGNESKFSNERKSDYFNNQLEPHFHQANMKSSLNLQELNDFFQSLNKNYQQTEKQKQSQNEKEKNQKQYEIIDFDFQNSKIIEQEASSSQLICSNQKPIKQQQQSVAPDLNMFGSISQNEPAKQKNDDLFTSPELLMQCRKFLKSKQNSISGNQYKEVFSDQYVRKLMSQNQGVEPLKLEVEEKPLSLECLAELAMSSTLKDELDNIQERQESFPVTVHHSHEKGPKYQIISSNQVSQDIQLTIQQILHKLMIICPNKLITRQNLVFVMNKSYQAYSSFFQQAFFQTNSLHISQIARILQKYLPYEVENEVLNIYRLLDFSKKGYITLQDIEQFLFQLKQAETDDFQKIQECLLLLFQEMTPMSNKSFYDYWSLFSIKQSSQFERLHELLQQYDFQIEEQQL